MRELFRDPSSPPWVLLSFSARDAGCFCGGRFSCGINEKLRLSHEKSIFSIYLASCTPEAHIRRRRLVLAHGGAFVMHSPPLLGCSVGSPPLPAAPYSSNLSQFSCWLSGGKKMLIPQRRDGIWRATGSLRKLLEGNERNKVFALGLFLRT